MVRVAELPCRQAVLTARSAMSPGAAAAHDRAALAMDDSRVAASARTFWPCGVWRKVANVVSAVFMEPESDAGGGRRWTDGGRTVHPLGASSCL